MNSAPKKMITELNPILSGDPTTLSRRGMSPITKRDILPVIIMSNYTPEECFPSANEHGKLEPLLDRITVVKCEGPIRIVEGQPAEDFATCSTSFDWPDEDLPPPPGSAPVLTDDYSEIFLKLHQSMKSWKMTRLRSVHAHLLTKEYLPIGTHDLHRSSE